MNQTMMEALCVLDCNTQSNSQTIGILRIGLSYDIEADFETVYEYDNG